MVLPFLGLILKFAVEWLPELLGGLIREDARNQKQNGFGLI